MTPRDNLLSLLRREGYEYAPVDLVLCPSLQDSFKKTLCPDQDYREHFNMPWRDIEDIKLPHIDTERYRSYYSFDLKAGTVIDQWGVAHEPGSEAAMHMTYMRHPMAELNSIEAFNAYPYPDYLNGDASHIKPQVEATHALGLAAVGNMQMTIWEASWYLRSMEQLMMDMIMDKEKAAFIIDKVLEISIHRAIQYARAGCDILYFGDDIGMQSSIMMSVDMYVEWFKPRLTRLIDEVKQVNPDILVFYHSCGYVEPFIPHLIEAGVDVLNPVQPECMDFEELHKLYGNKISFHGTIGTQQTMPFASAEDVRQTTLKNLQIAGPNGGLFCSPTHMVEPEVPWENILAYIDACKAYNPKSST